MFVLQNIKDFIENPMGKGSNAIPSRVFVKKDFIYRYHKLIVHKEKSKLIAVKVYKDKDDYFIHVTIPSEGEGRKNTYDVVLHFIAKDEDMEEDFKSDKNINRYFVKFFSNNPSFVFTYAYAFNINNMFVKELGDRYHNVVLSSPPVQRNTAEIISYEKSIFFACYHLLENNKYLNKVVLDAEAIPFDKKRFVSTIRTSDTIMMEIKKEDRRLEREKHKSTEETSNKPRVSRKSQIGNEEVGEKASKTTRASSTSGNKIQAKEKIGKITPKSKIGPRRSSSTRKR